MFAFCDIFGHISLVPCPILKIKKNWHAEEKEPDVKNIIIVVRNACLSSPVTT